MSWLGKITGFLLGALWGGPIGALVGLSIGHYIDKKPLRGLQQNSIAQKTFFATTFLCMGHVAKADGHISQDEIRVAENIMRRLALNTEQKRQAIRYFSRGKQADFDLESILHTLRAHCHEHRLLLRIFFEFQLQAASADGQIGPNKQRILQTMSQMLGVGHFDSFSAGYSHSRQQNHAHAQTQRPLNQAYRLIGVQADCDKQTLKRAYRKLMSEHHPDKLIAKGLPEEMIKVATEKTQEIQGAYEQICTARGY